MATLPPVPQVVQAKLNWHIGNDLNGLSVLHWHYGGTAPTAAGFVGMGSAINSAWNVTGGLHTFVSEQVELALVEFTDLTSPSAAQGTATVGAGGTVASQFGAAANCIVAQYQIARRYRGGKPRSYLPFGVPANQDTPQTWNSTFVGSLGPTWQTFLTAVAAAFPTGTTVDHQVSVSYHSGGVVRPTPLTDNVLGVTCSARMGSQRRRNLNR